jgi:hypothetical protein
MSNDELDASRTAEVDVEADIADCALNVATGRRARLQGSPREGPESVPKLPFHCEREIGFTALGRRLLFMLRSRGDRPAIIRIGAKVARHACAMPLLDWTDSAGPGGRMQSREVPARTRR